MRQLTTLPRDGFENKRARVVDAMRKRDCPAFQ